MPKSCSTFVQLDGDTLKVAQGFFTRSGPVLSALYVKEIKGLDGKALAGLLRETLAVLPARPHEIDFVLPRHFAIVRTIDLPSTDDNEIRELAGFQAVKQTPYSLDEMVLDIQILKKEAEFSKVSLVVVQKDLVERLVRLAQEQNLRVRGIRLATQAFEALLLAGLAKRPSEFVQGPLVFISVDRSHSHLMILSEGVCTYSRSLPIGSPSVADGPAGLTGFQEKLIGELRLSFTAYRKENGGAKIQRIAFEAGPGTWPLVREFLQSEGYGEALTLKPLEIIAKEPSARVELAQDPVVSCGELIGALVSPFALTLNLLPGDYKLQMQGQRRRSQGMQIAFFASLFLLLCLTYFAERMIDKKLYLHRLEKHLSSIRASSSALEARNERLEIIEALRQGQGEVTRVLGELYRLLPDTMSLSALSYERGRSITVKGTAKDLSDVFQLIPVLEKSDQFENVSSQYASKRKINDKDFTDFQIQCFITKGAQPKASRS